MKRLDAHAFGLINGLDGSKVEDVNKQFRSATFRYSIITLVTLAWSCLAFSGEIHDAAKAGDVTKITILLKENPSLVSSKDAKEATPLHYAAYKGNKDVVALLIANKADVNAKADGEITPLHFAALKNAKEVVLMLLDNNAEINAKDNNGRTPLFNASSRGNKETV